MKFSRTLVCIASVHFSARPSITVNRTSTGDDHWDCWRWPASEDRHNICKQHGHYIYDDLRCENCGWGWDEGYYDTYIPCKIECCDTRRNTPNEKCECTPRGEGYVIDHTSSMEGKNTAQKCCGRDKEGHPTLDPHNHMVCGCGEVGTYTEYGGHGSDCCSGQCDSSNYCVPRGCALKGQPGKCCRSTNVLTHPNNLPIEASCRCFHAGEVPNPNDIVDYGNCCSGKVNDAGNGCACIADAHTVLPDGALETDCCSGEKSDDGLHCKAAPCTEVGAEKGTNGDHCCSGKEGDDQICACVPPGEKPTGDGATERDCCSHKWGEDRVCSILFKGDLVPNGTNTTIVCNSGRKDNDNRCRCVNKGDTTEHETDCCSGVYLSPDNRGNPDNHANMCGCVATGETLQDGAFAQSCCTKSAVDGVCVCAAPGARVLGMMDVSKDCCAKDTQAGSVFCGCVGPNAEHNVTSEQQEYCCGGSRHFNGQGCNCVWDDDGVPQWAHEGACCSGKIVEDPKGNVCGKSEPGAGSGFTWTTIEHSIIWSGDLPAGECQQRCLEEPSCGAWEVCPNVGTACDGCYLIHQPPSTGTTPIDGWYAVIERPRDVGFGFVWTTIEHSIIWKGDVSHVECQQKCLADPSCGAWEVCPNVGTACAGCYLIHQPPSRKALFDGWYAAIERPGLR